VNRVVRVLVTEIDFKFVFAGGVLNFNISGSRRIVLKKSQPFSH